VDISVCDKAASFLQSGFWGTFKARFGWEARAFTLEWAGRGESPVFPEKSLLVLRRPLVPGFSLAYIPWGPELPGVLSDAPALRQRALGELAAALGDILPKDTAFIRFDPPWYVEASGGFPRETPLPPFVRSSADIQPPDSVVLDLVQPLESLLEKMKPKWRYNARLALKKGVHIRRTGAEEVAIFYRLLGETALRDGIAIHDFEYYRNLFESSWYGGEKPDLHLYLAEHEGDVLAGIVTLFWKKEAVYLYGASSGKKRNLMAPNALQLRAMEDARASGCEEYDLFGIPPDDDPRHPMHGLYLFKTGFGGKIVHRPGSWDYPCRPLVYRLFCAAESLRKQLRTFKKRCLKR
jgi:lipid II:glycine glycyltransferase (peptidoglycan interpeptide bridge formation enzyme)